MLYEVITELVAKLAVEGLVVAVLPRTARCDMEGLHCDPAEPVSDRLGGELAAVIRADVIGCTMADKELGQDLQHIV